MVEILDVVLEERVGAVAGSVSMETASVPAPIEFELQHFGKGEEERVVVEPCWRASLEGRGR